MNSETRTLLTEALQLMRSPEIADLVATALVTGTCFDFDIYKYVHAQGDRVGYWAWYLLMTLRPDVRGYSVDTAMDALQTAVDAEREAQHNAAK